MEGIVRCSVFLSRITWPLLNPLWNQSWGLWLSSDVNGHGGDVETVLDEQKESRDMLIIYGI